MIGQSHPQPSPPRPPDDDVDAPADRTTRGRRRRRHCVAREGTDAHDVYPHGEMRRRDSGRGDAQERARAARERCVERPGRREGDAMARWMPARWRARRIERACGWASARRWEGENIVTRDGGARERSRASWGRRARVHARGWGRGRDPKT